MIKDKKKSMSEGSAAKKGDFLSIMLEDELYKDDPEMIVDECATFMFAAT